MADKKYPKPANLRLNDGLGNTVVINDSNRHIFITIMENIARAQEYRRVK